MPGRETWIPPFAALRAFHAAARHGRFKDAAAELGVTESAISHQLRRLEDFLHIALFDRRGPKVTLTAKGAQYFAEIDPALARISSATRALIGPQERARVAMTLPPSLAVLWLIPRLADFEAACPGVDLQLVTTTRLCDLRREQIDLAIRYGRGGWPEVTADFLLSETAMPVCQPGYLEAGPGTALDAALASRRLIINGYHPDEWIEWAGAHGIAPPDLSGALRLETQEQILEAAERGLGIAIGRKPLIDERLKSGALVAPLGTPDPSGINYYLCRAPDVTPSAASRSVARWLHAVAGAGEGP